MSRLRGIEAFVHTVEAGNFTAAAERMNLTKSAVAKSVMRLEEHLGVQLLFRTTRRLSLTAEGELFYQRCVRILEALESAEEVLASRQTMAAGRIRVSLPVSFGRRWVMPVLLDVAGRYPDLQLDVSFADRSVDLVEEAIDLTVRLGDPGDSADLIARRLGVQTVFICGSPAYLADHGMPSSINDLDQHECITFARAGRDLPWRLKDVSGAVLQRPVKGRHTISHGDAMRDAVLAGAGLAQLPTWLIADDLSRETLVPVLPDTVVEDLPIHAIWPRTRMLSPRIRVVVDALIERFLPTPPWQT